VEKSFIPDGAVVGATTFSKLTLRTFTGRCLLLDTLRVIILNAVALSVIVLCVIILNVVMLIVIMAPRHLA
jgi:hypothetical protein